MLLFLGFKKGYQKGFLVALFNVIGYGIVVLAAFFLAKRFSNLLLSWFSHNNSWLNVTFWRFVAFWMLLIIGGLVFRMFLQTINFFIKLPVIAQLDALLGGLLGVVGMYLLIFASLAIISISPTLHLQKQVQDTVITNKILKETPYLSELWQKYLNSK
ncbi:hypothetical protein IV53_GL001001 [Ligilactobacillus ceti DSM 22408]|uniref:CvpA family protein n=1 Tax=Ligilactobacillus ceti DSM 22408 TaxID=1122146 RepID=A0A0R2KSD1_9LACO|nr:hypothetical protein IV53_GL001001 [Ligilactobacillus ceti DSM 22408]